MARWASSSTVPPGVSYTPRDFMPTKRLSTMSMRPMPAAVWCGPQQRRCMVKLMVWSTVKLIMWSILCQCVVNFIWSGSCDFTPAKWPSTTSIGGVPGGGTGSKNVLVIVYIFTTS